MYRQRQKYVVSARNHRKLIKILLYVGNENILGQCEFANIASGADLIPHREIKYVKNNFWLYILPFCVCFPQKS